MEKSILANNEFVPLAVGIIIFILIWVVIFKTLKDIPFFKGETACAIMATCMSLLSIISMFRVLGVGDGMYNFSEKIGDDSHNLDFILFPYAMLGITIVLILLILLANKLLGKSKPKKFSSEAKRRMESAFPLDLDRGDRSAIENLEKTFQERKMVFNNQSPKPVDREVEDRVHQSDIRKVTKSNRIRAANVFEAE